MLFPPPCRRAWVRGKAPWKCQGLGALPGVELCFPWLRVVDFIGSSQAGWFAERFFPLTPALPEQRENRTPRCRRSRAPRFAAARHAVFPLPAGEGKGEAEGALELSGTR